MILVVEKARSTPILPPWHKPVVCWYIMGKRVERNVACSFTRSALYIVGKEDKYLESCAAILRAWTTYEPCRLNVTTHHRVWQETPGHIRARLTGKVGICTLMAPLLSGRLSASMPSGGPSSSGACRLPALVVPSRCRMPGGSGPP